MQPSTFFALLASVVGTAHAGCYTGGETWGDGRDFAREAAAAACNTLAGDFSVGQYKSSCVQIANNLRAEFATQWKGQGSAFLENDECILRLQNEVGGCDHGGESIIGDFYFKSDPNAGGC